MATPRKAASGASAFIKAATLPFYIGQAILYLLLIPATLYVFPATTKLLTLFVLGSGLLGALGTLGDAIITHEQNKTLDKVDEEVSDQ